MSHSKLSSGWVQLINHCSIWGNVASFPISAIKRSSSAFDGARPYGKKMERNTIILPQICCSVPNFLRKHQPLSWAFSGLLPKSTMNDSASYRPPIRTEYSLNFDWAALGSTWNGHQKSFNIVHQESPLAPHHIGIGLRRINGFSDLRDIFFRWCTTNARCWGDRAICIGWYPYIVIK